MKKRTTKKRTTSKRPAVFLDRDGTIIRQVELLSKPSELKLVPSAARAISTMNKLGYFVVIITNQPVVARGIITPKEVDRIHDVLITMLAKKNAVIDAVYFCPHHPQANVKKYRMVCRCRKPDIGMIVKAAKQLPIDLKRSVLVGDSTQDVQAGKRAKLFTILVRTGHGGKDPWQHEGKPDRIVKDLGAAAKVIATLKK